MQTRTLGRTGPEVSALGLGAMGMSDLYGLVDEVEGLATIQFGALRDAAGGWHGSDGRPKAISHASAKAGQNPIQIFEPKGSGFP
ncbi:hypothetical protein ACQEVC_35145 [Plantactinospora sp. CA-294935]|uniref:hypothetical protein n=1 Tax=Plantactinospora sp. CA-294935 TaxID=3240012 RepID=UPI003D90B02A